MSTISIEIPDEMASFDGRPVEQLAREMRLATAVLWYRQGRISKKTAAVFAGIDYVDFMRVLDGARADGILIAADGHQTRSKATLTVIVGLPGSGKSTLMEELRDSHPGRPGDDFMIGVQGPDEEKSISDSPRYHELIEDLRESKSCAISDIIFCRKAFRQAIARTVRETLPEISLRWIFFENDPAQCLENIRRRGKDASREEEYLNKLSPEYEVPPEVHCIPVYSPNRAAEPKRPQ